MKTHLQVFQVIDSKNKSMFTFLAKISLKLSLVYFGFLSLNFLFHLSLENIVHDFYILKNLTGFPSFTMTSCGHMEGVRAENGPPGVGVKSESGDAP